MKHFRKHPDLIIITTSIHLPLARAIARESKKEKVIITENLTVRLMLYNHQTDAFCLLGKTLFGTTPALQFFGKRTVVASPPIFKKRSRRNQAARAIAAKLFPSPTQNLGLAYLLKKG